MVTLEISLKEQELIREINSDTSLLESALQYVKSLKQAKDIPPCQYSIEELKERLKSGRVAEREGIYKTQAEMRSKHHI